MCLRAIHGIVFKLGMQFGAYFAILAEFFWQMTKYYLYYAHIQLQSDEDTGSKIQQLDMKNNNIYIF